MKYTQEGLIQSVKVGRIHANIMLSDKTIQPTSFNFELEILSTTGTHPTIQSLDLKEWFYRIFNSKIIISVRDNNQEILDLAKLLTKNEDPLLIVNEVGDSYILSTIFNIVDTLLDEGYKLKSVKLITNEN